MNTTNMRDLDSKGNVLVRPLEESRRLQRREDTEGMQDNASAGAAGNLGKEQNTGDIWQDCFAEPCEEEPLLVKKLRGNYGYVAGLCLLYGILFAFCGYRNLNGITWPLLVCATIGIAYLLLKRIGFGVKKGTAAYVAGMVLLGASTAMTCSGFLVFFNMVGTLLLFLAGMLHQFYEDETWSFSEFAKNITVICFTTAVQVFRPFSHGIACLTEAKGEDVRKRRKAAAAAGVGVLIAVGLLLVVFPMLLRSDLVFAELFRGLFFEIEFGPAFVIGAMVLVGFTASYAFLCALCSRQFDGREGAGKNYNALTGITFTGILAAVYALYAGVQVRYLFLKLGSLPDGVTYSAYARQGFFELLFVGIVNFVLVLACMALFRENKLLRGILTVICGCTFIMIASAVYRMALYVQTYYLTLLRVLVLWFLAVLALIMAGVTVSIYRRGFPMFRYIAVVVGCGYILLSFARPDRVIAEYNLRHWETVSVQDVQYLLYSLSDDVAPVIAKMDMEKAADGHLGSGGETEPGIEGGWNPDARQEIRSYFYEIADRYECLPIRELNSAKLKARNIALQWIEEDNGSLTSKHTAICRE